MTVALRELSPDDRGRPQKQTWRTPKWICPNEGSPNEALCRLHRAERSRSEMRRL